MASLKEIRKRVTSVKNTQKITRAMKLVSGAKLRRAQDAMNELRPYADKHRELLESLVSQLGASGEASHPLFQQRKVVKRIAVLALTSDRGMCAGFNSNLQRRLRAFVAEKSEEVEGVDVYPIGRRVGLFAKKMGYTVPVDFGGIIDVAANNDIAKITSTLTNAFLEEQVDEVYLIFNVFKNALYQEPAVRALLPVVPPKSSESNEMVDLIYEPDQRSLLSYIVPRYVEVQVRSAILESIAGEHAARMNAMSSATDNANDMIRTLTLQMNRARQAAITKELMEIIGGSEALK